MKLTNPYSYCDQALCGRVSADISPECFNYFFRGMFAGARTGVRAALIAQFFDKLHQHCLKYNLKPVFDPSNESTIAGILARLNFDDTDALRARVEELTGHSVGGGSAATKRPPTKRSNPRTPKSTT